MKGRFGILVFVRFGSSRLRGKALIDIEGRPLLGRVIDRVRRVKDGPIIVVATSALAEDDVVADFARSEGVETFRGSLDDVGGRAVAAAQHFDLELFARVCGDRPFLDPDLIAGYRQLAEEQEFDLVTNAVGQTYAPGLTTEIVRREALRRALDNGADAEDREHVTRRLYRAPDGFRVKNIPAPDSRFSGTRLVVDTPEDLDRARAIAAALNADPANDRPERIVALGKAFDRHRTELATP